MDNARLKQEIDSLVEDMNCLIDLTDSIKLKVDVLSSKVNGNFERQAITMSLAEMIQNSPPKYDEVPPSPRKGWQVVEVSDPLQGVHFCWQNIPIRARRVLKHYKVKNPMGLRSLSVRQIKKMANAGPATIEAIRELCSKYNIVLKD